MRVLFIDDRPEEIFDLCAQACLPEKSTSIHVFESLDSAWEAVSVHQPTVVVVGHGLSAYPITGSDVVHMLRQRGYTGILIGNSGGGPNAFLSDGCTVDYNVNRQPNVLRQFLLTLEGESK